MDCMGRRRLRLWRSRGGGWGEVCTSQGLPSLSLAMARLAAVLLLLIGAVRGFQLAPLRQPATHAVSRASADAIQVRFSMRAHA